MRQSLISEIEIALRLHINYRGISSQGRYLKIMDSLAGGYPGAKAYKLSALLDDYYKAVGVRDLTEALSRLRKIDENKSKNS